MNGPAQATTWTAPAVVDLLREQFRFTVSHAQLIGSGAWSDCFRFDSGGEQLVVRVGRFGTDFRLDDFAGGYTSENLPIPQTRLIGAVGQHHFSVSEFVPGEPIEHSANWMGVVPAFVALLDALRALDPTELSGWGRWTPGDGGPFPDWRSFLLAVDQDPPASRVHGWKDALATSAHANNAFERGYERLQSIIVDQVPRSLIHGDLLNRNVHATPTTICGVFDWGNSMLGDHLYDLAMLCFWEPWLPNTRAEPVLSAALTLWEAAEISANFEARLHTCMLHTALEHVAYHAYRTNWAEVDLVIERMHAVALQRWPS